MFKDVLDTITGRMKKDQTARSSLDFRACCRAICVLCLPHARQHEHADHPAGGIRQPSGAVSAERESNWPTHVCVGKLEGWRSLKICVMLQPRDAFYWFRKQIALDLLSHEIATVIPMFPYYGKRKPKDQFHHIIPSVSDFFVQICSGVLEAAAIGSCWAAEFPEVETVFTGVSMGGSVANVAAILAASNSGSESGNLFVVATCSATSFLTGVLHNRIAWKELSEAPWGC